MTDVLPRFSIYLRLLRLGLTAGGLYDLALAALLALAPGLPAAWLGVPPPAAPYRWLLAVLLTMLAAFYALAAYDAVSYSGNVAVAIAGRGAAGVVLAVFALGTSAWAGLLPLAIVDLAFAAAHAVCWAPIRR